MDGWMDGWRWLLARVTEGGRNAGIGRRAAGCFCQTDKSKRYSLEAQEVPRRPYCVKSLWMFGKNWNGTEGFIVSIMLIRQSLNFKLNFEFYF